MRKFPPMTVREFILKYCNWGLFVFIPLLSFLMHLHVFPTELVGTHAWRQCETASNVANFYEQGFAITDPHVYHLDYPGGLKRMEFPIMQWVMAQSYKVFGPSVVVLRVISWLIGLLSIWGMFVLIRALFNDKWTALAGAWCFSFSPVFFYYSVNPLPDNLALAAGIWGLAGFVRWHRYGMVFDLWVSAGMLMLSTLAKLPFILFYMVPLVYLVQDTLKSRFGNLGKNLLIGVPFLLLIVPAALWYLWVIPSWTGNGVVTGILEAGVEDIPEILRILVHNVVSTLPELLVNYAALAFFLCGLIFLWGKEMRGKPLFIPLIFWALGIAAYFFFEINMIGMAHDYYLFPFLPGIFLVVAYGVQLLSDMPQPAVRGFVLLALVALPVTAALRAYPRWQKMGFTEDLIVHRDALRAAVPADARVVVGHDRSPHIFLYHLGKFGWSVNKDEIYPEAIQRAWDGGASFLYSSDRAVEQHPLIAPHVGALVAEYGTFRIFRIKSAE